MKEDNKKHQIIKKSEDTLIEHLLNLGHEDFWHIWGGHNSCSSTK